MADWDLKKRGDRCVLTGQPFQPGETIWSALFEQGARLYRVDFCEAAWKEREAATQRAPLLIEVPRPDAEDVERLSLEGEPVHFWKHVQPEPDQKPRRRFVDDEVLFDFFKKLDGSSDQKHLAFRYVLALHLIRRKVLAFADVVRAGEKEYLVLTPSRDTALTYKVLDPHLSEEQVLELRGQMDHVLDMGELDEHDRSQSDESGHSRPADARAGAGSSPAR